ncbi:MAG: amidohydrolase family protein [Woeseiaceae bacterium]|nr:amidohydrolase family protein [Woeseiaceae bacterium]
MRRQPDSRRGPTRTLSRWPGLAVAVFVAAACTAEAADSPYATTLIVNGRVIAADSDDIDDISFHEAVAIRNEEIIAVGSNEEMARYVADWTETIDAGGNTVLPGLIDTHNHLYDSTLTFPWVIRAIPEVMQIRFSASDAGALHDQLAAGLRARAAQLADGAWIQARIDPPAVAVPMLGTSVTRQFLDEAAPANPVVVYTRGGSVYNTPAIASIERRYRNPIPADFWIDADKGLSGDQTDGTRCSRVDIIVPEAKRLDEYTQGYLEVLQLNAQTGVTTHKSHFQCEGGFNASVHLDRNDLMPIRMAWGHRWMQPFNPRIAETYWRIGDWVGYGSPHLWSIGSSAGALDNGGVGWCTSLPAKSPELKARERCPTMDSSPPNVRRLGHLETLAELAALGRQTGIPGFHVAGDAAVSAYLDAVMNAGMSIEKLRSLRLQVDHCHSVTREQIEIAARINMAFSCDATRVPSAVIEDAYGEEYLALHAPVASMLKAGARAVISEFGSQSEIRHSPFEDGVMWMTRKIDGENFGVPEEAVPDRLTLLLMMTRWGAYALWKDDRIGSIEPGKWADLIILNGDYMAVEIEDLDTLKPIMTMVGGKVVFESAELRNNVLRFDTDTAEWEVRQTTPTDLWRWDAAPPVIPTRELY